MRSGRVRKIVVKGKVETVSLERHLNNEPAIHTGKQRKMQNNTKNSKNTATVRREPALKQNSEKKKAEPKAKTQTRSVAVQHGTNLATTSQHNANRVNLSQQFTPYGAPHSLIPAVSRAGATEVCERIHVYLYTFRLKALIQTKRSNHQIFKTIRISPKATKLYQTQPDEKSTLQHVLYRWSTS